MRRGQQAWAIVGVNAQELQATVDGALTVMVVDDSLTVRRVTIDSGEQVRVVEGGPPGRSPVLFIHGWGASVYFWRCPRFLSEFFRRR